MRIQGICGAVTLDGGEAIGAAELDDVLRALDHAGTWAFDQVWLGGARLGGLRQEADRASALSMADGDAEFLLVADVRLDNRQQLGSALGLGETASAAASDHQLLALAYRRWGRACTDHLVGDYACAIWDARLGALFCFRDAMAMRPFYYHRREGRLFFASEAGALRRFPGVPQGHCAAPLVERYSYQVRGIDPHASFYEGIRRLPAASTLVFDARGVDIRRTWRPPPHVPLPAGCERVGLYLAHLSEAVDRRLRGAGRVGMFVSGGFDSSSIAALAARRLAERGETLHVYTAAPWPRDDAGSATTTEDGITPYVEALAASYPNIALTRLTGESLAPLGDAALFAVCEQPAHPLINRIHELARAAHGDGVDLLLAGFGGDQVATPRVPCAELDLFLSGRFALAWRELRALSRRYDRPLYKLIYTRGVRMLIPAPLWRAMLWLGRREPLWRYGSVFTPGFIRASGALPGLIANPPTGYRDRPTIRAASVDRLAVSTASHAPEALIRMMRQYGMTLAFPMLDRDLVEYALRLPAEEHVSDGRQRHMIRRAMRGLLPPEILERPDGNVPILTDMDRRVLAWIPRLEEEIASLSDDPVIAAAIDLKRLHDNLAMIDGSGTTRSLAAATRAMGALASARWLRLFEDQSR